VNSFIENLPNFVELFLFFLSFELFAYWCIQFVIKHFKPVKSLLFSLASPALEFSEALQLNILLRGVRSGVKPKDDRKTGTEIQVAGNTLYKVALARLGFTSLATLGLVVVYMFTVKSFLGLLVFFGLGFFVVVGIMPSLELRGWDFTVMEHGDSKVPAQYRLWFFGVFTLSPHVYAAHGVDTITAFAFGLVWSVIYYKLVNIAAALNSSGSDIVVKYPPGRGLKTNGLTGG